MTYPKEIINENKYWNSLPIEERKKYLRFNVSGELMELIRVKHRLKEDHNKKISEINNRINAMSKRLGDIQNE